MYESIDIKIKFVRIDKGSIGLDDFLKKIMNGALFKTEYPIFFIDNHYIALALTMENPEIEIRHNDKREINDVLLKIFNNYKKCFFLVEESPNDYFYEVVSYMPLIKEKVLVGDDYLDFYIFDESKLN